MSRALGTLVFALVCVVGSAPVGAATIEFTATDLGGDRWQYDYLPSDHSYVENQGFTVFFELGLYSDLAVEEPLPPDWDPIAVDPDPNLVSNGFYDALALVTDPSLAGPFRVSFRWLGVGTPGSQPFEVYELEGDFPRPVESGRTVPAGTSVPEPSTLLLATGGAIGCALRRRRRPLAVFDR